MMETYAERLRKKKEEKMTNYDMDEIEREERRIKLASVKVRVPKETTTEVEIELEIELPESDLLTLALLAHEKDITLNQLVNNVLRDSLKDFEHQSKPQLLNEDK